MKNWAKTLPGGHREGETSRVSSPVSVSLRGSEGWRSRKLPRCRWCLSGVREGDAPESDALLFSFSCCRITLKRCSGNSEETSPSSESRVLRGLLSGHSRVPNSSHASPSTGSSVLSSVALALVREGAVSRAPRRLCSSAMLSAGVPGPRRSRVAWRGRVSAFGSAQHPGALFSGFSPELAPPGFCWLLCVCREHFYTFLLTRVCVLGIAGL